MAIVTGSTKTTKHDKHKQINSNVKKSRRPWLLTFQHYRTATRGSKTLTPKNLTRRERFELVFNGKYQRTA